MHIGQPPTARVSSDAFYRLIGIASTISTIRSVLLDPFHHFRVEIRIRDNRIASFQPQAVRTPFDLCPGAGKRLDLLIGQPVTDNVLALIGAADARNQCTHLFDLSAHAVAVSHHYGRADYRVSVLTPLAREQKARIERNGQTTLEWHVRDSKILSPPWAGTPLERGFTSWAAASLSQDAVADALMLRRAWFISQKLKRSDDPMTTAPATGSCWAQMPQRAHLARRLREVVSIDAQTTFAPEDEAWLSECPVHQD